MANLLELTESGLYCPGGDFYIDPWRPVRRAVITHAHSDHARPGSTSYVAARDGVDILRLRLQPDAAIEAWEYGESTGVGDVRVSLHPAGHVLGSAQVRLERAGEVWVVSGDYKVIADGTCRPLEPLRCHTFVTESTFGLPIFHWQPQQTVFDEIHAWWRANQEHRRTSILFAYSLGKAQRILAHLQPETGPILAHGAVMRYLAAYERACVRFPPVEHASLEKRRAHRGRALVLAPPLAMGTPWLRSFGALSLGIASGWMQIRGIRRRKVVDRGFVLSDHADWPGLLATIEATGASRVWVTHGYAGPLARWLTDQGLEACPLATHFVGETAELDAAAVDDLPGESETSEPNGSGAEAE